jgi:enamine deaminase RidA (YjgF/YER057c/UK114 family)
MQDRQNFFSGLDSERHYGYCRAVRVADRCWVSGSTALESGGAVAADRKGNAYEQSAEAFRRIDHALKELSLTLPHVVSVRAYVTDVRHIAGYLQAHREFLGQVFPAATLVGTPFLAHPDLVVEIEVEAAG